MKYFTSWIDFYPKIQSPVSQLKNNNRISFTTENGNIYIKNLLFLGITNNLGHGGALSFISSPSSSNQVLIEFTLFSECKVTSTYYGGAIYFEKYGDFKFHFVCGFDCQTNSQSGQFSYILASENNNNISLILISIIKCCESTVSFNTYFGYGTIDFESTNISDSIVSRESVFFFQSFYKSTIKRSSFENNYASGYFCLDYASNSGQTSLLSSSNVINNSQEHSTNGIIVYNSHNVRLNNCFLMNNRKNNKGVLFQFWEAGTSCTLTIEDCYIDSISGSYTIINTFTFYNFLILIDIEDCRNNYKKYHYFEYINTNSKKFPKFSCFCHHFFSFTFFSKIFILFFNFSIISL
jgi:hypothetical protein